MVRTGSITMDEVLAAGRTLFGPAFSLEQGGWRDALKATYRRRVLETHPDRARALGRSERDLVQEFSAVADAYRILSSLRRRAAVPTRPPGAPRARRQEPQAAPEPARTAPRVRPAVRLEAMPRRPLRFAEFLYYSGRIRWTELVEALGWQRAQRPRLGRIAVELGFLRAEDVGTILERRREAAAGAVPFGEWAMRLGYLTRFQLLAALGCQHRSQRPIGRFFVERGILEQEEVEAICRQVLRHNARFSARSG